MFFYQLRLAAISLRKNPVMTLLSVGAVALGIVVSCGFVTFFYVYSADPIPDKSAELFYVRLDSWSPDYPIFPNYPERPPIQLTYRDATALLESDVPVRQAAMWRSRVFVSRDEDESEPDFRLARFTTRDFFALMNAPMRYGDTWSLEADRAGEAVVVLAAEANERFFGGADSVGERLRIAGVPYTVVGVLDDWRPAVLFYDVLSDGPRGRPEELFLPFALSRETNFGMSGSRSNWLTWQGGYEGFLQSEATWIQMWVELDSPAQREEYQAYLNAYTEDQRKLGRFQRPTNNWVQPLPEWLAEIEVTPASARPLLWIGLLFLAVCSVNLIGLLLGKLLNRAPEVGVRRALGASRRSIFLQYLVECEVVSLVGGVLGWVLLYAALQVANRIPEADLALRLNLTLGGIGLGLALLAGFVAGAYPAWRLSQAPPAIHLKVS